MLGAGDHPLEEDVHKENSGNPVDADLSDSCQVQDTGHKESRTMDPQVWDDSGLVFHEDREDDFDYQIPEQDDFDL